jgi:hypothetical protein
MARYDTYSQLDDVMAEDLDRAFSGFNNRLRPDQLKSGILADSKNGRMSINGEWQTRKGIENLSAPVTTGAAPTVQFFIINEATGYTSSAVGLTSQKLRITVAQNLSTTFSLNDEGVLFIDASSLTGITLSSINHKVKVVSVDSSNIIFEVQDVTFSSGSPGGSVSVQTAKLNDAAIDEVYGSCLFSNPNDDSDNYIIIATNEKAVAININTPTTTYDLAYPSSNTVSASVDMIQAFNKLYIFRDGQTAFVKDLAATNINTSPTLELVDSGTFSQPVPLSVTNLDFADGIATATAAASAVSTLSEGATIKITTAGSSGYSVGDLVIIQSIASSTTFTFITDKANATGKNCEIQRSISEGLGFTHMPAPKYGVYHQRRLAVPFRYSVDASQNSFTDRKIFDEILLSDVLDSDTYDRVYGQFRFNAGMSDFNVGIHSFSDDKLVVFNRNSIHQVSGSGNIAESSVQLLTDEVGLIARKSISQVGNTILFLSDNGVYGLTFVDRYNLRGTELPLSETIDGVIQRINKEHAEKAVAVYFDNRYYIAVPLDSATENNAILIYNFLNKAWESVDTVQDSNFEFTNLIVGGKGDKKGVYVVNKQGGVHKLDALDSGRDSVITEIGTTSPSTFTVNGVATTRMFTLNSIDRKKWNNFELHMQSGANNTSDLNISVETENIDGTIDIGSASAFINGSIPADEDVSIRGRIGNKRAYGLQMTLTSTEGRPRFRSLKVAGSETKRSTTSVQ